MSNPAVRMEHNVASDEIDLRELILQLWRSRVSIVLVTLVVFLAAGLYAYLATPVYQVRARALPPAAAGLEAYNSAYRLTDINAIFPVSQTAGQASRTHTEPVPLLTPAQAHQVFVRHLASTALKRNFFEQHYAPSRGLDPAQGGSEVEQAWRAFVSQISVDAPRRPADGEAATLTWQGADAFAMADWANTYMQMAVEAAQEELSHNLHGALQTLKKSLDDQVASLRAGARKEREQRIVRLGEALLLAESIGLVKPSDAGNLITSYTGETAYMRGADALRNEIRLLKNRRNDDPYIPELTSLFMHQSLLETVSVRPQDIVVAQIDEIATPPVSPIKPRKALILALGLVLGGMLGVFIALVRNMFRND